MRWRICRSGSNAKAKHLILSAPHTHPLMVMEKAGFLDRLGRENVCPNLDASLARAREILAAPPAPGGRIDSGMNIGGPR